METLPNVGSLRQLREAVDVAQRDPKGRGRRAFKLGALAGLGFGVIVALIAATTATGAIAQAVGTLAGLGTGLLLALVWVWITGTITKGRYDAAGAAVSWVGASAGISLGAGIGLGAPLGAILMALATVVIITPLMMRATLRQDDGGGPWALDDALRMAVHAMPRQIDKPIRIELERGIAEYVRLLKLSRGPLNDTHSDTTGLVATAREGLTRLLVEGLRGHHLRSIVRTSPDPEMERHADKVSHHVAKLADALERMAKAATTLSVSHLDTDSAALDASTADLRLLAEAHAELASEDARLSAEIEALEEL